MLLFPVVCEPMMSIVMFGNGFWNYILSLLWVDLGLLWLSNVLKIVFWMGFVDWELSS
jgi:hypothetical protein